MKLNNIKLRNTELDNSPFEGVILTSGDDGVEVDLNDPIIFENIQGVILDGNWDKRPLDLVEVLKKLQEYQLQLLLETNLSMTEFKTRLGIGSYNKVNNTNIKRQDISPNDLPMMEFMGAMLMNFYMSHTEYYIASKENGEYRLNNIKLVKENEDERN